MEKIYKVFVSSTYIDLVEERKIVSQALLEKNCIPIGMELFPASNEEQWCFIKSVIDSCDYYLLILAGRYGSIDETDGFSYTEKEYRYALETEKPIISLLHMNIDNLPRSKLEKDNILQVKLNDFNVLVKKKLCDFWENQYQLSGLVHKAIDNLIIRSPAIGWIKGSNNETDLLNKINELSNENENLRKLLSEKEHLNINKMDISCADDFVTLTCEFFISFDNTNHYSPNYNNYIGEFEIQVTWNELLKLIAYEIRSPVNNMNINSVISRQIRKYLERTQYVYPTYITKKANEFDSLGWGWNELYLEDTSLKTILTQFEYLGFITFNSINNEWLITDYGFQEYLNNAIIKKQE